MMANCKLLIVNRINRFINFFLTINNQLLTIKNSGFTLIEVLVAATIVALLSTIGISSYQAVTRQGRDALRKSDMEQIRSALEIYKSEENLYPDNSSECTANLSSGYINPYPQDPKSPSFRYCYAKLTNLTYNLCAHLENGTAVDYDCDGAGGSNDCTSNCNYKVTNP